MKVRMEKVRFWWGSIVRRPSWS